MTELNLVGRTIGRFEVLEELGRGGMAVVYKARQKSPNRIVAFKVLPPELTYNKDYIARFHQEADSAAALEHPHIVPIYAVDEDQGLHYIAMKFIQGRTLKEVAQAEGAFSVERAVQLVGQIADALDYAHSQNVIHRDIKPSNMMVTDNGWVYLTDFGLARGTSANAGLTATGTVMGTPEYMSPEQAQGSSNIGPATDIYALGVVLYELLTGRFPFESDTPMGMLAARLIHSPRPPREYRGDLPLAVEDVIMRALARKPEARYKTAGEMIADLRKATGMGAERQPQRPATPSDGLTIPAVNPTPTPQPQQFAYRPQATPQPQPQPTPSWPQQAATTPAPSTPAWQQTPSVPPPPARKGGMGSGILIGIGATILVLVLACIGIGVWASSLPATNTTPTPQVSLRDTPGAQTTPVAQTTPQSQSTPVAPTAVVATDPQILKQLSAGDEALLLADYGVAGSVYDQALKDAPNSPEALNRKALLNEYKANYKEVVAQSNQAIDAAQGNAQQEAIAQALLADGLLVSSKFTEAVEAGSKAVELDTSLGLAHAAGANAIARLAAERLENDQADEVRSYLATARQELKDDPKVFQALTYSLIGDAYVSLYNVSGSNGDIQAAKDAYDQALQLSEQPLFHTGLGFANNSSGDYAGARGSFNKALELDSTFALAQLGLGWADFHDPNVANFDPALANFQKALEMTPDDPWTQFAVGRAFFAQSKYPEATDMFLKATTTQPDSLILAWLGRSYQRQGFNATNQDETNELYKNSADALLRSIQFNDRQIVAWTYLGWTRQYQEQYDESIDAFQKSIAIDEKQDEAHNGLGWSFYNSKKYAEAEKEFLRATELYDKYENAFYGLGQTLEQLGKIDDAKQAYNNALKANPDYKDAKDALAKLGQ